MIRKSLHRTASRAMAATLAAGLVFLAPDRAVAETPLTDQAALNALCNGGTDRAAGCDAIRAREIVDATVPPWRAIGRVNFASISIRMHCTGTLVSDRVVLTAAHCLYNAARKSWIPAQSITFAAGYARGEAVATSAVARYVLAPMHDPSGGTFQKRIADDWALLILEEAIGRRVGHIDITAEAMPAQGRPVRVAGYPALRPHVMSLAQDCGNARATADGAVLSARCAIMQGDSGAPMLSDEGGAPVIVGIISAARVNGAEFRSLAVPATAFAAALRRALTP